MNSIQVCIILKNRRQGVDKKMKIAVLGYGTVGSGVVEVLDDKSEAESRHGQKKKLK